jgi:Na+:H+ antiporter, NhaA family
MGSPEAGPSVEPVGLGVIVRLVLGKVIGVFGGAYLTARFTRATLAPDLGWTEVFAVAVLAGVGFTVALLISELAFEGRSKLQDRAKAAVLVASLLAAGLAAVLLRAHARAR